MALSIPLNPQDQQRIQVGIFFYKYSAATASWIADGRNDPATPTNPTPTIIYKNIVERVGLIDAVVGRMIFAPIVDRVTLVEAITSDVAYRLNDNLALSESIAHDGPTLSVNFRTIITPWFFNPTQGVRPVDVVALKEVVRFLAELSFTDQTVLGEAITLLGRIDRTEQLYFGEGVASESFEPPPVAVGTKADTAAISETRGATDATMSRAESILNPVDAQSVQGTFLDDDAFPVSDAQSYVGTVARTESLSVAENRTIAAVYSMAEQYVITDMALALANLPFNDGFNLSDSQTNTSTNGSSDGIGMVDNTNVAGAFSKGEFFIFNDQTSTSGTFLKAENIAVTEAVGNSATQIQDEVVPVVETWDHDGPTLSSTFTPVVTGGVPSPLTDPGQNQSRDTADSSDLSESFGVSSATMVQADSVSISESRAMSGSFRDDDSVGIMDGVNNAATNTFGDSSAVTETRSMSGTFLDDDVVSLSETRTQSGTMTRDESVSLQDSVAQQGLSTQAESAAIAESRSFNATFIKTDTASAVESIGIASTFPFSENVTLAESRVIAGAFARSESAAITDGFSVQQVVSASIAVKQVSNALRSGTESSIASTFPSSVTAGSMLIAVVSTYYGGVSSVTGSRNGAYTKVHSMVDDNYNQTDIWIKANAAAGTETVTISPGDPNNGYISGRMIEVSGITAVDRTGVAYNSYSVSASAANTTANSFVLTAVVHDTGGNANWGLPSGYTLLDRENDSDSYTGSQSAYKIVSATETSSATVTSNSPASNVDSLIISFRP